MCVILSPIWNILANTAKFGYFARKYGRRSLSHRFFLSAKVAFECWEMLQAPDIPFAQIDSWSHGVQTQGCFSDPVSI